MFKFIDVLQYMTKNKKKKKKNAFAFSSNIYISAYLSQK